MRDQRLLWQVVSHRILFFKVALHWGLCLTDTIIRIIILIIVTKQIVLLRGSFLRLSFRRSGRLGLCLEIIRVLIIIGVEHCSFLFGCCNGLSSYGRLLLCLRDGCVII